MTATGVQTLADQIQGEAIVNDMSINVATANGSGSQTSNSVLVRAIFGMGIPVEGKNLFPSNIQGLPTWFVIRANGEGFTCRKRRSDVTICMNPDTATEDARTAEAGSVLIYDDSLGLEKLRDDLILYPVPFKKLVAEHCPNAKLRKYVVNMIYVGVCCELFGIDMEQAKIALSRELQGKQKAIDLNLPAMEAGAAYCRENFKKQDAYRVAPLKLTDNKIIMTGNEASALGAVFGGCSVLTWYPITPSSSVCEQVIAYWEEFKTDRPDGKRPFIHLQAEDELAAVGIAIGAAWTGARAMTATSGPGISLMQEFVGLAYYAEVPVVIGDVGRTGPSTGLPTRTSQGDVLSLYYASHGDTQHIVYIPGTIRECYDDYVAAFDAAARYQAPVFVMSDLDLGMNYWLSDPFPMPAKPLDRGKVLYTEEDAKKLADKWGRYKDVDGDGIPYRTLPGSWLGGAFFTRGSGHDASAKYTESPEAYVQNMDRLKRKYDTARKELPQPIVDGTGAKLGVLAYGTSDHTVKEVLHRLRKQGAQIDYLRVRALPPAASIADFIAAHDKVVVIEQNRDAQMRKLLSAEFPQVAAKMDSLLYYGGWPLDRDTVQEGLQKFL